ncbi:MAG TPA: ester cyclase [Gemmatimonadaceae bacterium]|nr:ester cyclase [Gemmatimonadaceae bacterium]
MTTRSNAAAILLAFAILSCAVYQKKQPTEGDKAVVTAYVEAWNQRDSVAIDTLLARDGIHEDVAQNFKGKGSKEVVAFMRDEVRREPDFKWTVTNVLEDGRNVAVEWTWVASYTGPDLTGKQITNRRISGKGTSIAEVDEGKIKRFTDYYDIASFFR